HACVAEMPLLNTLVNTYKTQNDIIFIGLALDSKNELREFLTRTKFNYIVAPNIVTCIRDSLKINLYLTDIIINKKGVIIQVLNDCESLKIALKKLIYQ